MAKQGMKRPERTHVNPKNDMPPVPEIQGKAKSGKEKAKPIIAGTKAPSVKVFHEDIDMNQRAQFDQTREGGLRNAVGKVSVDSVTDSDLGSDNMVNDLPAADVQDL